jgi:replication-associated recombination protein RarA
MNLKIKYAPTSLAQVVFPSAALESRIMSIAQGKAASTLLLHGTNGTGKTVVTALLAQHVAGNSTTKLHTFGPRDYVKFGSDIINAIEGEVNSQSLSNDVVKPAIILDEVDKCKYHSLLSDLYDGWERNEFQWYACTNKLHAVEPSLVSRLGSSLYEYGSASPFAQRVHDICKTELGSAQAPDVATVDAYLKLILVPNDRDLSWRRVMRAVEQIVLYQQGSINGFCSV